MDQHAITRYHLTGLPTESYCLQGLPRELTEKFFAPAWTSNRLISALTLSFEFIEGSPSEVRSETQSSPTQSLGLFGFAPAFSNNRTTSTFGSAMVIAVTNAVVPISFSQFASLPLCKNALSISISFAFAAACRGDSGKPGGGFSFAPAAMSVSISSSLSLF